MTVIIKCNVEVIFPSALYKRATKAISDAATDMKKKHEGRE